MSVHGWLKCRDFLVVLLSLLMIAGCAKNRASTGLGTTAAYVATSSSVPFLVATVRQAADQTNTLYTRARANQLNLSTINVRIPEFHRAGTVETAPRNPDPRRNFTAFGYKKVPSQSEALRELNERLESRLPSQREVFLFVHGYNNNFAEGLFRNAQIVHDYRISGVPVHFSWASASSFTRYVYDRDSALIARRGLSETLEMLAKSKSNGIVLVGHSMGGLVIMEALRTLSLEKRHDILSRISGVMLAASDLDPDLFNSQLADIEMLPQPFTIVVSRRDRALDISRRLAGGEPRIGSGHDIAALQKKNIQVLDISQVENGSHTLFASSNTLISLLGSGHLLRRMITDEYAGLDTTFRSVGQSTFEQASLALHLPVRIVERLGHR